MVPSRKIRTGGGAPSAPGVGLPTDWLAGRCPGRTLPARLHLRSGSAHAARTLAVADTTLPLRRLPFSMYRSEGSIGGVGARERSLSAT